MYQPRHAHIPVPIPIDNSLYLFEEKREFLLIAPPLTPCPMDHSSLLPFFMEIPMTTLRDLPPTIHHPFNESLSSNMHV